MSAREFPWIRFWPIDFFPSKHASWEEMKSIVVGTQARHLADALLLTTLPARLKTKYPHLKVYTFAGGLNPTVFKGNPFVDGIKYFPREIFGDGIRRGEGHLIQIKEKFFSLEESQEPRPELYLTLEETHSAKRLLQEKLLKKNEGKPLCILHCRGTQTGQVAPIDYWDALVKRYADRYRFWQIGLQNDPAIQGCEYYFLPRRTRANCRKLFALMSQANAFVGVDASPMHVASAFRVRSLVLFQNVPDNLGHCHYASSQNSFKSVVSDLSQLDEFFI